MDGKIIRRCGIYKLYSFYDPYTGRQWTLRELVEVDPRGFFARLFEFECRPAPHWDYVHAFSTEPTAEQLKAAIKMQREDDSPASAPRYFKEPLGHDPE